MPMAKAIIWFITNAEKRKYGEKKGFDTLVFHTVKSVY